MCVVSNPLSVFTKTVPQACPRAIAKFISNGEQLDIVMKGSRKVLVSCDPTRWRYSENGVDLRLGNQVGIVRPKNGVLDLRDETSYELEVH